MTSQLAPGFLAASPSLRDPNFHRTLVMLVEHGDDGSLGFVVNRPAPVSFPEVVELLKLEAADGVDAIPVHAGGPVAPHSGWILFDPHGLAQDVLADAVVVSDRLAVSASRSLLSMIARREGPETCLLALGYAGWAPEQLDGEFGRGVWIPIDLDERLVFELPAEERWAAALDSVGIDPARISAAGAFRA